MSPIKVVATLWFVGFAVSTSAAPIPKDARPAKLTPEMLHGTWKYAWASRLDGAIEFNAKEGTYLAQHAPGASTIYSGTFSVGDNSITLTEWGCDVNTGRHWGPTKYIFVFEDGLKGFPTLTGKTSGGFGIDAPPADATMSLVLSNRK